MKINCFLTLAVGLIMAALFTGAHAQTAETEKDCTPSIFPAKGFIIQHYGCYFGNEWPYLKFNPGIRMTRRTKPMKVIATAPGIVKFIEKKENLGYIVTIDHGCGYVSRYRYIDNELNVKEGQTVKRSDVIGSIGTEGSQSEPLLVYIVEHNGTPIDLRDLLPELFPKQ